ncbi:MAG: ATP-binding protein [Limnospira sp.]
MKNPFLTHFKTGLPLQVIFIVPFVVELIVTAGMVGYLSFVNGQKSVDNLAEQLIEETGDAIRKRIDTFLEFPSKITQNNQDLIDTGLLDLENMDRWLDYLYREYKNYQSNYITAIVIANDDNEFRGAGQAEMLDGRVLKGVSIAGQKTNFQWRGYVDIESLNIPDDLFRRNFDISKDNFDVRNRPWYGQAIATQQSGWVEIFSRSFNQSILVFSFSQPIYIDGGDIPRGVTSVQIDLSFLNNFLRTLKISQFGQIVILDQSGNLVATSTAEKPALVGENGRAKRLMATGSENPLTRAIAGHVQTATDNFYRFSDLQFDDFRFDGERYFLRTIPIRDEHGLEWLVAIAIPESAFMAEIYANNVRTIILSVVALGCAIAIGILTSRWVTKPILQLNQAAKQIAAGNLETSVDLQRGDAIGELGMSFNRMAYQLKSAFEMLEEKVKERTRELEVEKEKAEVANRAKSSFLANMSHELRTPLNAILGFSQIMTRSSRLNPEDRENLTIINRSGEYLLTLINQVLDLSKIEAGKMTVHPSDFNLYALLDDLENLFSLKAQSKRLALSIECDRALPQYIRADETKLRQILVNLLNNAIKFTEEGGVSLRVACQNVSRPPRPMTRSGDRLLLFEIEDTGAGISSREIDHIFEAFGQTKTGIESKEGTGLGLTISRKFVQLMGGDMRVKSKPEVGTIFSFEIAVSVADGVPLPFPKSTRRVVALAPGQPRYKILVVDDKAVNRALLIKLLQPVGFELREAGNGREAIAIWERWDPHLICMDMRMPVMDGYEATKSIKGTTKGSATVIIALTASIIDNERAIVLSAGCDDLVRKPFRESVIFETIAKHLGVQYCYEEERAIAPKNVGSNLTADDLTVMPQSWLMQLHQAAVDLDDDVTLQLLAKIPSKYSVLAEKLTDLVDNFQLNTIRQKIEKLQSELSANGSTVRHQ